MDNHIIQSLWVGNRLSKMEQLCIHSFLANGHEFHLYLYDPCENVPEGTVIKDANEIILKADISKYPNLPNFSDIFRYYLLQQRACWWVDFDVICLKPFDFPDDYVFASEEYPPGCLLVNGCLLKAPAGSPLLQVAIERCNQQDSLHPTGELLNGGLAFGPELLTHLTQELELRSYVKPRATFTPISCQNTPKYFIDPQVNTDLSEAYACHLFHSKWVEVEGSFPSTCFYEQWKRRFL